jgi:hypothetical protein
MGGGDGTPAPNTPTENNDEDDEDYRRHAAAARVGRPRRLGSIHDRSAHSATPPLLVKFDVQNITFNMKYFEHHPGERSKCFVIAAAAVSATTVTTISTVANDIGSQQPAVAMVGAGNGGGNRGSGGSTQQSTNRWQRQ